MGISSIRIAAMASAFLVPASSWAATQGPLTVSDLVLAANKQAMTPKHKDVFTDVEPNQSIAGRMFRVVLPVHRVRTLHWTDADKNAAWWDYDSSNHMLRLEASEPTDTGDVELLMSDLIPHGVNGFYIHYNTTAGRGYAAQNAFGAVAQINTYHTASVELVYPKTKVEDDTGFPAPRGSLGFEYKVDLPLDGATARETVKSLQFVLEGQIIAFEDNSNIACGRMEGDPSMLNRMDQAKRYCLIAGRINRVSFQSAAGTVFKEWERPQ